MRQVTIYHNVSRDAGGMPTGYGGYKPGDAVTPVFIYLAPDMTEGYADDPGLAEAEHAFTMFNADLEMQSGQDLTTARQYRALRLRSLSIGDLVTVDRGIYVCGRSGFQQTLVPLNVQPDPWEGERWADPVLTPADEETIAELGYGGAL